jgi:hypothetical protein
MLESCCCERLQIGVGELLLLKREGCRNHFLVGVGELRCGKRARLPRPFGDQCGRARGLPWPFGDQRGKELRCRRAAMEARLA